MHLKTSFYIFSFIIFVFFYEILNIWFGIDTIYDEGFLILKSIENSGLEISQSNKIVNFLLNNNITLFSLKLLRVLIQLSPILFVLKFIKNQHFQQIFILFLVPGFAIYTSVISYNHLTYTYIGFLVLCIYKGGSNFVSWRSILIVSPILFLSIITIPPFGVLLSLAYTYFVLSDDSSLTKKSLDLALLITGVIISLLLYSFFISNLFIDFKGIIENFQKITNSNRGYSKRDLFISLSYSIVQFIFYWSINFFIVYLVNKLNFTKIIRLTFLILINIFLTFYFNESDIYIFILPITYLFFYDENKKHIRYFALLILPLIFSFGTNTSVHTKAIYYIVVWVLYLREINFKENINLIKNFIFLLFISNIFFYSKQIYQNKDTRGNIFSSRFYLNNENIKNIGIREKQKMYLQNVEKTLHDNNIGENPTCLGFQLEHMTFYVFNLQPLGVYFQPTDFILDNKRFDYSTPKLLFLNDYEFQVISSDSVSKKWSFPYNYKKIPLGTPEDLEVSYSTKRDLYIRRNHN